MGSLVVVIIHVPLDSFKELMTIVSGVQIHIFSFQRSPEALDPLVIQASATSIHTDLNSMVFKKVNPGLTRKLRPLVGVDDIGFAMPGNGLTKDFVGVFAVQRVGKAPTHNVSAVHVNDSRQVHKSPVHGDVRDVNGPNLIGMRNLQLPKLVGMDILGEAEFTQVPLGIDGHDPHSTHQSFDAFGADQNMERQQKIQHLFNSLCGMLQMFLIYQSHDLQGLKLFIRTLVKQVASMNPL